MTKLIEKGDVRQWIPDDVLEAHEAEDWVLLASVDGDPPEYYVLVSGEVQPDLTVYQAEKWLRVKELRTAKEEGVAPTTHGPINIDEKSKTKIGNALSMCRLKEELSLPFSINFKFADNVVRELDNVGIREVAAESAQYIADVFEHSFDLESQIGAATTLAQLEAIDIEAGWPE